MELKRRLSWLALVVFVSLGATCPPKPKPPVPPDPPEVQYRAIAYNVRAAGDRPIVGATVRIGDQQAVSDATGYALVARIAYPAAYPVQITAETCEGYSGTLGLEASTPDPTVTLACQAPRPTVAQVLDYRGLLANLRDEAGRVIWTPALPGAPEDVRAAWLTALAAAGATHVPIGPFTPGPAYPGVSWPNPDWQGSPVQLRALVLEILNTPTTAGHGMVPVVFLDSGARNPKDRLERVMQTAQTALDGLWDSVLVVPTGWEPVVGDWTSAEVSWALERWHAYAPRSLIGYHGSPERLVGSSNPVEPDDPWQGGESEFYKSHGGQYINVALYQTRHGREIYEDCDENVSGCWLDRFQDYVARIGGGLNGWRVLKIALFESVAYEFFNGIPINGRPVTMEDARVNADRAKRVCDKWKVACGYGNGLPH